MVKIDLFREHRDEYAMPREPILVNVKSGRYPCVSGTGGPKSAELRKNVGALAMPKATWRWKLLIRVPGFVGVRALTAALAVLRAKGRPTGAVKLETLREGKAVQVLHVGPYGDEPRTLAKMDSFRRERGLRFRGKHHEIYLSDPRRVAPDRFRTILRHPVSAA